MPDISRLVIEVDSKGVVTATGNLENFVKASDKAGKGSGGLTKNFGFLGNAAKSIPGPIGSIAQGLTGLISPATLAAGAVVATGAAIVKFSKDSIQAFSDFEMIKANLETVMGSAEQAGATFNELRDMAARTPFGVEGLANAAVQLKQTGTAANDLIPVLTMLGDTAGGSSEKFNRIVANFAQIQSVGKASSMDLKQFAMAGLPVYDMLQKLGVQGTATAEDVKKAFEMMAGEGGAFFGAMSRGAETLQGKTANLDDTWKTFKATLAETTGLADLWKETLDLVTAAINNQTEALLRNKEFDRVGDAMLAWNAGIATADEALIAFEAQMKSLANQSAQVKSYLKELSPDHSLYQYYSDILRKIELEWQGISKQQAEYLKKLNEINAAREEELRLSNQLMESTNKYRALQEKISEAFGTTTAGQIKKIRDEIKEVQGWLTETHLVSVPGGYSGGKVVPSRVIEVGISDDDRSATLVYLDSLYKKLADLTGEGEKADKVIEQIIDWDKIKGYQGPRDEQLESFFTDKQQMQENLAIMKEYGTAYEEQLRLKELTEQYGNEGRAEEIYALEQEIEKVQALNDALIQLREAGIQLAAGSLVSFANDLGKAFQDGAISGDEFSGAIRNMLRSLIDAMPQLLLNVGLQLISKEQWQVGLAFIGASGLMSFVSGMIGDAEQDNNNDEMERLKRIQEQISDLIDAQRKQQEYYLTQKRKVDSTAVSVNDAIITPRGTVYTHPEDYIIATKTPETLMGNGGSNVVVQIINNAGAQVSQQESIGADGTRQIQIAVDRIVQNGIASGRYNGAFDTMNMKNKGRALTN